MKSKDQILSGDSYIPSFEKYFTESKKSKVKKKRKKKKNRVGGIKKPIDTFIGNRIGGYWGVGFGYGFGSEDGDEE
jgi:hypothetical protein